VRLDYVIKRFFIFLLIFWAAATINFFLPRLSPTNPVREKLLAQSVSGGYLQQGMQQMVEEFEKKFGLDRPLWEQYVTYFSDVIHLDFNYSISNYPKKVSTMMVEAIPWTIALLMTSTILAFLIGTFLGALLAWPKAPKAITQILLPPLLTLSAIPYYILGLLLLWVFAFTMKVLPIFGGYTGGVIPDWSSLAFWGDVFQHSLLPGLSIVLAAIGFWALGMRAMMVTTQGEDYMVFAEAKGLQQKTMFLRYAVRNALLPQTTSLALQLGHILSGSVLVEVVFSYPGIGTVLYRAIRENDYYLIQGILLGVIFSIGLATFILDLVYPLLDPRITYRRA
jgi:peptide/nickel transport system permease protein